MKLSIGMMVKNEEKNLERCLISLQPLMNAISSELIIVDTGSTDNTVNIAKKFTNKIYFHPWENDYSKMRNRTVDYAQGEWFFFIDADEELVEYEAIIKFFTTAQTNKYNAAALKINNVYDAKNSSEVGSGILHRFFRRTKSFRFIGVIHEAPYFEEPMIFLDALLLHYGYPSNDPELKERKMKLYEPILLKAIEEDPENIPLLYYLANTYATFKEHKDALEPAIRAYETAKKKNLKPIDYFYVYGTLAVLYNEHGYFTKTEELVKEGLECIEWAIDLWFCLAKAQGMLKKYQEAIQSYQKYLFYLDNYDQYVGRDHRVISNSISRKEEVYLDLAILYKDNNQKTESLEVLKNVTSIVWLEKSIGLKISLLLSLEKYSELKDFYQQIKKFAKKDLEKSFYYSLEVLLLNEYKKQCNKVSEIFQNEITDYGLLSRIRLCEDNENVSTQLLEDIKNLNLEELGPFYGDIFYFLIRRKLPLHCIDHHIQENELIQYFEYLTEKYPDLALDSYEYLSNCDQVTTFEEHRILKILQKIILLAKTFDDAKYKQVLDMYIRNGIYSIKKLYQTDIFESGKPHLLANNEDVFFYYMNMACSVEQCNQAEYVRNMRKALHAYPCMKKGIEILLKKITEQSEPVQPAINDEMKAYAQIVKTNVKEFIKKGMLKEAKEIIQGYEELIPNDPEIQDMKASIAALGIK